MEGRLYQQLNSFNNKAIIWSELLVCHPFRYDNNETVIQVFKIFFPQQKTINKKQTRLSSKIDSYSEERAAQYL